MGNSERPFEPGLTAVKRVDFEQRVDAEPVVRRAPLLADAVRLQWSSGVLGSADVPGPSTYWMDVVATLGPSLAAQWRQTPDLSSRALPSDFNQALTNAMPQGDYLASPSLDAHFSHGQWRAKAYLSAREDVLLLQLTGR